MPYLIGERTALVHIPKTGGIWARSACAAAGLGWERVPGICQHSDEHIPDRYGVAFLRNPVDWLRSFWCYHQSTGWSNYSDSPAFVFYAAKSAQFGEFVNNYLAHMPGGVDRMFSRYLAASKPQCVGRFERLADDLVDALKEAGETFDEAALRATPPANVTSSAMRARAEYSDRQLAAVLDAEYSYMKAWGYV